MKITIVFLVLLISSCKFISTTDSLMLAEPVSGLPWAGRDSPDKWEIRWISENGVQRTRIVHSSKLESLSFEIPRERAVIVLAEPLDDAMIFPFVCRPAGAVLGPGDPRPSRLALSWENGFAAELLMKLQDSGTSAEAVNLRRFTELCLSRSGGNPWVLDRRRLLEDLLAGDLWVYSFRSLDMLEVEISLPAGKWYPEYPLGTPLIVESENWCGFINEGLHRFTTGVDGLVAEVSVGSSGTVVLMSD